MALTLQEYADQIKRQYDAAGLGGIRNQASPYVAGATSDYYQRLLEQAKSNAAPAVQMEGRLTRFDPSTKTRVPVTQEWIDEAVAEIVRLNREIEGNNGISMRKLAVYSPVEATVPSDVVRGPVFELDATEQDRIWEAVRAASAV